MLELIRTLIRKQYAVRADLCKLESRSSSGFARQSTTILKQYVFRRTVSSIPISFAEAGSVMLPCD
jgi:hypothetical protein